MSMITLSRSNHNRYAVFYMIAGIVLSLSILAALLMPHPAAVFLKKPGKCPCRIGLVFLFIVRNFTASVKKESDEFSLKGRLPSRRKFSAIKGKVPLGSPVGIIEEGWSVLDRFRREDA